MAFDITPYIDRKPAEVRQPAHKKSALPDFNHNGFGLVHSLQRPDARELDG